MEMNCKRSLSRAKMRQFVEAYSTENSPFTWQQLERLLKRKRQQTRRGDSGSGQKSVEGLSASSFKIASILNEESELPPEHITLDLQQESDEVSSEAE